MKKLKSISKGILTGLAALVLGATPSRAQYQVDEHTRALYHLDGNAEDATGVNHGNPLGPYEWTSGFYDQAVHFNRGEIVIPNHPSLTDSLRQLTLEAWIKPDSLVNGFQNEIIRKNRLYGHIQYELRISDDSQLWFEYTTNGGLHNHVTFDYPFQNNTWYHVAATYDGIGARVKLWINHNIVRNRPVSVGNIENGDGEELFIGYDRETNSTFFGTIDEVRISDIVRDFSTTSAPEEDPRDLTWGRIKSIFK